MLERSAQILRAAGYDCVLLLESIGKARDLLGVSPHGLILVSVVRGGWPEMLGLASLGVPPRWPVTTLRVIHRYADDSTWPAGPHLVMSQPARFLPSQATEGQE